MACIKCDNLLPTQRFDLQLRRTLPWTNASLHQPPLYARRKPPARSVVVPSGETRSSSLGWGARAKARRIVTSSSSVRVGAAVPPKSGFLRYWKACGRVSQLRFSYFEGQLGMHMLQCMSPLVALSDRYCIATKCPLLGI